MNLVIEAAIRYATEWEWPAFFVSASKSPFAGSHGFLDASLDPAVIRDLWRPNAAVALAVPDGIVVVDVDPGADTSSLYLPRTREQHTPRHGRHLVYTTAREVRPTTNIRSCIDLRGPGSYIVVEPTVGYWWVNDLPFAVAPSWLYDRQQSMPARDRRSISRSEQEAMDHSTVIRSRTIGRMRATISTF